MFENIYRYLSYICGTKILENPLIDNNLIDFDFIFTKTITI